MQIEHSLQHIAQTLAITAQNNLQLSSYTWPPITNIFFFINMVMLMFHDLCLFIIFA